jgi:hypothetical protein
MFFSFNTIFITYNTKSIFTGTGGLAYLPVSMASGSDLNIQNEVNDLTFTTKFIMKTVKEKIDVRDQEEWYNELFNDRGNQNGNKLRTLLS